ncbi:MAG TPA: iron-containing alcohol dehydrogenase, partial [Spirochaetia bacterium]|nr:iron-containing alcohol dehydrogenase [Spirochaetia bacterium]
QSVSAGVNIAVREGVDCIVALGGGSAMDCAKLIAVSAKTGVDPFDYVWGSRPEAADSLDTVMIPTIAATGTELNNTAVIVNEKTREKYWCVCKYPKYCIIDPTLSASLPLPLTVWGAMDVLSHTFEYYFNGFMGSELQLRVSEALMMTAMNALDKLIQDPGDVTARGELLWCSTMTWGSGLTKIGRMDPDMTCHSIEESFSGYFDTHHGACLGVLTPRWMRLVAPKKPEIFARFARNVFGVAERDDHAAALGGVDAYIGWLRTVGAPRTYFDLSPSLEFSDTELKIVADNAWRIYNGKIGRLYPVQRHEIDVILRAGREPL